MTTTTLSSMPSTQVTSTRWPWIMLFVRTGLSAIRATRVSVRESLAYE